MKTLRKKISQNTIARSFSKGNNEQMRTTKSSKNIYFSIEKKVRNISVKPENDQNSYATQIENIFKQNKIDENNQEILFQNELFRKLLKGLNEILDEKIQKRTNKFQNQKLTEKPDVSNDITLNKEFKKNQTIIKRQNKEFLKLETRFSQIQEGEGDYLENLENEIKKMKNDLEMKKKEKRNQFDSTKLNAKVLEDIVEVKGMPENLQKSSVIDSDLSILMVKKKNLKKKLEKNRIDFEFLEKKVEKIEEDFIVSMKEAYDLKISFEKNDHKLNYEKLSLKIIRFKQCIQQITSTNKKILKKSENENEVLKVKLQEMESKVTEKNLALDEIRQKLSKVLSSDNIDKNLKGMLDLFTRNQNQNYSEVSPTSSLKVSAQTNVILKNHEDLLRDVILNKEEIIPANKEKIKINKEFKNENNLIESNEKKLKLNYNLSDSKKMKDAEDFTKEKKKKNNKLNEPDDFKNENIHYKKEETTPKKETQIHQKNEKVDRFENGENEKEIPVKSEEFYEIETFNANFKRGDSEKKLEIEKINFEPVFIRGEKNSENPIKILEEHFKEQIKDMPENKKEDSFEIKKNILEIKKNDDDANKKDQKNDKFENNKNEVRTELFNSKKLKSKPLKKIKNEGCGTLTISPQSFHSINEDHLKMIFCRIKIGNRAYNTKVSGEKEHKPSWDEIIEIRKLEEEHKFVIQIWNFDPKHKEQFIGETMFELNSKEIDIYSKKILHNNFGIFDNGIKKGDLLMEISWLEDEIKKYI